MQCRVCDSSHLELAIDLGSQPWCNHFLKKEEVGKELFYPLRVVYCRECATAQLDFTVPKETMFSDHTYLSGTTRSLSEHFKWIAGEVDARFFPGIKTKSVLDIGSNDGTQLKHFQALGYDAQGVESSKTTARIAESAGVPTLNQFFNRELAQQLGRQFDVINAAGVFFHMEELHSATEGIRHALKPGGVFVVQFLYMKRILENLAFDQIYHEHLLYYNLRTIESLLNRHGLALFDAELSPIHGGSMIAFVAHRGERSPSERLQRLLHHEAESGCNELSAYRSFGERIKRMKVDNLAYLEQARQQEKRVYGLGAPAKGNTLMNYLGVDTAHIQYLVERNELRRGLYSPGTHIPIIMENEMSRQPDIYYVLAWNFKQEILSRSQHLLAQGVEFFFPVNPSDAA